MFNQRQPRRFNIKSRLPDSKKTESREELKAKWEEMRGNSRNKSNFLTSLPMLLVFLVCVFVLIYILNGYIN
ncbi:MAG: hypothetical protein HKP48_11600 [Winogradskyella sp.]|uniref:hypothetical protein n=1 Tax=Winogradskyella sp. TaxID=1883156 RepID=UPI0017D6E9CC|nr:hypothetical protein [Winogradskyella sp.]MBT8245517.1 hypothetical protein [Winogradskyella sp.]NNK23902.1 hypothetical protein [Winogradskyella sp.]